MSNHQRGRVSAADIAKYTLVVAAVLATTAFMWAIRDAFLIAFAGVIFAVILNGFAGILRKYIPISHGWSIALVGLILAILVTLFGVFFGPQIVQEFNELTEKLPQQISELQESVREWPMGDQVIDGAISDEDTSEENGNDEESNGSSGMSSGAGGMIFQAGMTFVDAIATVFLIIFIGIYFVIDPKTYKDGIALLFTKQRTERIVEGLETAGNALWHWVSGQFIAMAFVGIIVTIGLMIIGVPLPFVLGLIAGLSEFVPILGPWIGAVPGILLAFSVDTQTALFTAILYLLVQQIESNILTPLIQQHMVKIPPAIVIISVVAFGLVFGIAGIILATPLAVVAMVLIGMFYVQDVLGKEISVPGEKE